MQRRFSRALHFKLVQVHHRSRYLVREAGGVKKQQGKGGERAKYPLAKLYGALKLSERRKKKREFGEYQEFCRRRGERGSCFIFMNSSPRRAIWRGPTSSPRPLLSDIKMITSRIIRGIGKFTVGPFSFRAVGPVSPFNERV